MDELLMCSICLDRYSNPKRLICDHSFCAQCLKDLLQTESLRCPECRQETPTPTGNPGDVDNLPNDLTLRHFLELRNNQDQGQQSPSNKCFLCESIFTNNCPHCSKDLCKKCGIQHLKSEVEEKVTKITSFVHQHKNEDDVRLHLWSNMKMSALAARMKAVTHLNTHFDKILNSLDRFLDQDGTIPDVKEAQRVWQRGQQALAKTNTSFLELHITMNQCGPTAEAIEKLEKSMDKLYDELLAFQWHMNESTGEVRQTLDKELGTEKKVVGSAKQTHQLRLTPSYSFYEESSRIYMEGENDDVVMANEMVTDMKKKRFNNICRLLGDLPGIPGRVSSQEEIRWNDYGTRQNRSWVAIPAQRENAPTNSTQSTNGENQQTPNITGESKAALVRTALHQKSGLFNTPLLQFLPEENPFQNQRNPNAKTPNTEKDHHQMPNATPVKAAPIVPDHIVIKKEVGVLPGGSRVQTQTHPAVKEVNTTSSTVQPYDLSALLQAVDSYSYCTTEAQRSAFMEKVRKAKEDVMKAEKMATDLKTNPLQEQRSYEEIHWGYYNVRRQRKMVTRFQKLAQERINSVQRFYNST